MLCYLCNFSLGIDTNVCLSCNHVFHKDCIDVWFRTHITCPECRLVYVSVKKCVQESIDGEILNTMSKLQI